MNKAPDVRADIANNPKAPRGNGKRLVWRLQRSVELLGPGLYVVAVALIVITGWAAYMNVAKSGWGSDAAAWMQAAGSIAAIAGAGWLAQSEARRARKLRRASHEEAAWYVRFAIRQAQFESHIIASELVNRTTPIGKTDVREWRQRASTSALGLTAQIDRIDHIHPAVTQVTSNAKVLVDDLVDDLTALSKLIEEQKQPNEELIGQIVAPHHALSELLDAYDDRMRGVMIALDEGGDVLPIANWQNWNSDIRQSDDR